MQQNNKIAYRSLVVWVSGGKKKRRRRGRRTTLLDSICCLSVALRIFIREHEIPSIRLEHRSPPPSSSSPLFFSLQYPLPHVLRRLEQKKCTYECGTYSIVPSIVNNIPFQNGRVEQTENKSGITCLVSASLSSSLSPPPFSFFFWVLRGGVKFP